MTESKISSPASGGPPRGSWLARLAPGILVAATGVGAGDLVTAALASSKVGVTILWVALAGAILKWVANEGLARWQMATGTTLLEGWVNYLGRWIRWVFLIYLIIWSFMVGATLIKACGVAAHGLLPLSDSPELVGHSTTLWGITHSIIGAALVLVGGFRLFEKMMAVCIGVMFVAVVGTVLVMPDLDWAQIGRGLIPRIPDHPEGLTRVVSVLGGVGGTLTLLSYGYWIREAGRQGESGVRASRIDLTVGYGMTAVFGLCMIIIGSQVALEGKGAQMAILLARELDAVVGPAGRWVFLVGFWGAVFSSLLGVWQSVPYLFADFVALVNAPQTRVNSSQTLDRTPGYRAFLIGIAVIPSIFLGMALIPRSLFGVDFAFKLDTIQLTYSIMGASFFPILAITLLIMNNRVDWVGPRFRSGPLVNSILAITLAFFTYSGYVAIRAKIAPILERL